MNRLFATGLYAALISLAFACSPSTPVIPPPPGERVAADVDRDMNPDVSTEQLETLVAGNNAFAFDMYQLLRTDEEGNFFYSPHSISSALAMTWAGANGITETEMQQTMHFDLGEDTHLAMNALDLELASRGEGAQGADGKGFRLRNLNQTWGQIGYPFEDDYLEVLALNYGAGVQLMDFREQTEPSRVAINDWVAEVTEDRIDEVIPAGVIEPSTRFVLTNAIYFNAAWENVFPTETTMSDTFHTPTGDVETDLMNHRAHFGYADVDGVEVVSLPYDGEELSMVVLAPALEDFATFEATLDGATVTAYAEATTSTDIQLTFPKFGNRTKVELKRILTELGMPSAFDDATADFSGINGGVEQLVITDVLHEAFVKVNEKGTEAAASTAVVVGPTSAPPAVRIDRPFVYVIRDDATGAILFVGRILDPTK